MVALFCESEETNPQTKQRIDVYPRLTGEVGFSQTRFFHEVFIGILRRLDFLGSFGDFADIGLL